MEENRKKQIAKQIGEKIYALRKDHKLTREKFAELCNISAQHVYYMERGEFLPGCITLIDICNQFHVSPTTLLFDTLETDSISLLDAVSNDFEQLPKREKQIVIENMLNLIHLLNSK